MEVDELHQAALAVVNRWFKDGVILASEMLELERTVDAYSEILQFGDEEIE